VTGLELFLEYEFLQLALAASGVMALLAGALGVPLVLREMAMFGHGFAHVSYAGVALGLLAGLYPLGVALVVTVVGALVMERLRARGAFSGDTRLAVVVSVGFAIGVTTVSLAGGFTTHVHAYLFGSLFSVTSTELWAMLPLAGALLAAFTLLYKEIFYITLDEEAAHLSGVPVGWINAALLALTAATIVLASRVVGLLLVAALLVIPAATALQMATSFKGAILGSMTVGLVSVVLGLAAAVSVDVAAGGAIVLVGGAVFALVTGARRAGLVQRG
jgi:zinc transport system permease protein